MARQVLIVTGDGGECYETLYAVHRMAEAGHGARIAAPSRKRLHLVIHDFEPGWDTYIERPGYGVQSHLAFDEVRVDDYDAVLVLGGRAPEYLRNDPRLLTIVRAFDERGKWVFGICHGVQVLLSAGLARGRRVTAYEHVRFEVEAVGGVYVRECEAVRDGRLVTGQTWQSHPDFYREVMACLAEDDAGRADAVMGLADTVLPAGAPTVVPAAAATA
jgi:protease I